MCEAAVNIERRCSRDHQTTTTATMELVSNAKRRKPVGVSEFESKYRLPEDQQTTANMIKEFFTRKLHEFSLRRILMSNFPIFLTLKQYSIRNDLLGDLIAGLTCGIMVIPQGLAFASLSTLQPITGLYISFFSSLVYFFLGTGRQLSFGCIAVLSIMLGSIMQRYEATLAGPAFDAGCQSLLTTTLSLPSGNTSTSLLAGTTSMENSTTASPETTTSFGELDASGIESKKLQMASAITLLCGIIFAVLGKVGLGNVTVFMSDSLVIGFAIGVSFHVGSSQLKTMFGLSSIPSYNGTFNLIRLWVSVLANIGRSNVATVIMSVICILITYIVKRFVNEKYLEKIKLSIPIEFFVLLISTLITFYVDLNEKFAVAIIKDVPLGIPTPCIPNLSLAFNYWTDGLIIMIVAFSQSVSIAKLMGLKHNYKTDSNQEMFALGLVNIVCSVFSGYFSGASMSRSVVQDSTGGRTQVASLVAALIVLIVMLALGPFLYYVPECALSAIIIVSLRSLVTKLLTIPNMWRRSKVDCTVCVTTVLAVVILDIDMGLFVGIATSIFLVVFQCMKSTVDVTAHIPEGDLGVWKSKSKYAGEEMTGVRVVRINYPLYFVNAEIVTNAIFRKTGLNPIKEKESEQEQDCDNAQTTDNNRAGNSGSSAAINHGYHKSVTDNSGGNCNRTGYSLIENNSRDGEENEIEIDMDTVRNNTKSSYGAINSTRPKVDDAPGASDARTPAPTLRPLKSGSLPFTTLVLDMSGVSFIDSMGVTMLEVLIENYVDVGVQVKITNVTDNVIHSFKKCGFMEQYSEAMFLNIEDSILAKFSEY